MINAHVIFEGVDRCGKSSLVEKFCAVHSPAHYKMRVPSTLEQSLEYYHEHLNLLITSKEPSVWDRGVLSELVYGTLYRPQECPREYREDLIQWTYVKTALPVVVVYVFPLFTEILLKDERPNADRQQELKLFNKAFDAIHWRKVAMTKHTIREGLPAWKNRDESWLELSKLLEVGLGV